MSIISNKIKQMSDSEYDLHVFRHIFIDSANRTNPNDNSNNFSINIDFPTLSWEYVSISAVSIPNSVYTIQNGYNTFVVTEAVGSNRTVTIPAGFYNQTTFISAVLTALNTGGITYTMVYQAVTNTYLFTVTGTSFLPIFTFSTTPLSNAMGFGINLLQQFNSGTPNYLQSTESVNLPYMRAIQIKSDIVDSSQDQNLGVILNVNQNANLGYIYYEEQQPFYRKRAFTASGYNTFQFTLCDQSGNLLDLQNEDWTMTLVLIAHNSPLINQPQARTLK